MANSAYKAGAFMKSEMETRTDEAHEAEKQDDAAWKAVCKLVDERDGRKCRACGRKSDPDAMGLTKRGHRHHVVYRSQGGKDESSNVATLCFKCHDEEHVKRTLRVEGNADIALTFYRKSLPHSDWYVWRQEIGVRQFHRD